MIDILWFVVTVAVVITMAVFVSRYFFIWLQARFTGTHIAMIKLVAMSLRRVDPNLVVQCRVMAAQAGLADISTEVIEAQHLAGGSVMRVTLALIAAHRAGIPLTWDTAAAIDLAGRDILEAVRVSVNPKVIDCPAEGYSAAGTLDGVAQDGVQLKVRVRVTVRTDVTRLVGGATEATVIARVGEGIVSAIGSCRSYLTAVADPLVITRQVLEKGLDADTSFAIVSIDIADITVGRNVGASLQIDQANADIRIARASAEQRRAMAIARHQEMVALTTENRARVVLAESEIPHAVAAAFCSGNVSRDRSGKRPMQLAKDLRQRYSGAKVRVSQFTALPVSTAGSKSVNR